MSKTSYWVIAESDIDLWHSDAEEIEAGTPEWAAEVFAETFGDEHDDGEDLSYVVASNRAGTDAKSYVVSCEVIREYSCVSSGDCVDVGEDPDDGPNEHFDDDSDEQDAEEKRKGCEDDQTLSLFDTSC